jgi:hypothetical protein
MTGLGEVLAELSGPLVSRQQFAAEALEENDVTASIR